MKVFQKLLGFALTLAISLFHNTPIFSQYTLYSESFTAVVPPALPGGWTSNTAQVFTNNPASNNSSGYPGASGGTNLLARNCTPIEYREFMVSGISTLGYGGISISFGHRRTNCFTAPITLDWSNNGTDWTNIQSFSIPSIADAWFYAGPYILPSGADNKSILYFRWSYTTVNPGSSCSGGYSSCSTTSGNYRIDDFVVTATTLPIELINFQGTPKKESVELLWTTASESNSDFFQVERSKEGADFQHLSSMEAAGFSTSSTQYVYSDPSPHPGPNYYRLKQVDFDGSFTYSPIIAVDFLGTGETAVFPNPFNEMIKVKLRNAALHESKAVILDLTGRQMGTTTIETGELEGQITTAGLQAGHYILKIQNGQQLEIHKVVKM